MKTPLEMALSCASKGWKLFPIEGMKSAPPLLADWPAKATSDPAIIRQWALANPGCNWGIACGPSNLFVLDIDRKNGKNGDTKLALLELDNGGLPETLTVATPTGGEHRYFVGRGKTTVGKLRPDGSEIGFGPGLDTRSEGGYVVAPGSVRPEGSYLVLKGLPPASLPSWVNEAMPAPSDTTHDTTRNKPPVVMPDSDDAIAKASEFLAIRAEPAVEGNSGDFTTYQTAAFVKDFGISEAKCLDLMWHHYNPRCSPPWTLDDIRRKVRNAYAYGQNNPGVRNPAAIFKSAPLSASSRPLTTLGSMIDPYAIQRRRWVLGGRYIRGYITVTVAPGGTGKSAYTIAEALSITTGRPLTGSIVKERGATWLYNEDPQDELERRIAAACLHHNIPFSELSGLHITSFRDAPLILAANNGRAIAYNEQAIQQVINHIKKNNILVWFVDPFIGCHELDENDNMAINKVVQVLHRIAEQTGCCISVIHHTRKRGASGGNGDQDTSRGASALVSAARLAHTLNRMTEEEAVDLGLMPEDSKWHLRVDSAKSNLTPPATDTDWFKLVDVVLPCGDHVGTIEPVALTKAVTAHSQSDLIEAIQATVGVGQSMPLNTLCRNLKGHPKLGRLNGKHLSTIRRDVLKLAEVPLEYGASVIGIDRLPDEKNPKNSLVEVWVRPLPTLD